MGLRVTAAQAAFLVDRHERIIRWHLQRGDFPSAVKEGNTWRIDTSELERIAGWRVDPRRLAELQAEEAQTAASMAARLEAMEARIRALEARLRAVESGNSAVTRSEGQESLSGREDVSPNSYHTPRPPVEPLSASYALRYTAPAGPGTFAARADAARWLMRHGINAEGTPKSWPGWRDVRLEPRDVLRLAVSVYDPANWRITWRLHPCDDSACVCHELLQG